MTELLHDNDHMCDTKRQTLITRRKAGLAGHASGELWLVKVTPHKPGRLPVLYNG